MEDWQDAVNGHILAVDKDANTMNGPTLITSTHRFILAPRSRTEP